MFRCSFLLAAVACFSIDALVPALASAQSDLSSCKLYSGDSGAPSMQLEDVKRFYGTAEQPARIVCDELQFSADDAELFSKQDSSPHGATSCSSRRATASGPTGWSSTPRPGPACSTTRAAPACSAIAGRRPIAACSARRSPKRCSGASEIEKLGPKKYRITRGGFTTCVQPTPRWELVAGTVTLNLDDYALLTNALFRVKGVPLMYLPVFYYPIQEDDRATGFLIPTYGSSTLKGQIISNAFFWAIGRSHDATIYHDWILKAGQQLGGEYRYVLGPGSQGNSRFTWLNEKPVTATDSGGVAQTTAGTKSYSIGGDLSQRLPGTFSLRGNADYFSSIVTQQSYQQDLYRATNRTRRFGTFTTGSWRPSDQRQRRPQRLLPSRHGAARPTARCRASTSAVRSVRSAARRSTSAWAASTSRCSAATQEDDVKTSGPGADAVRRRTHAARPVHPLAIPRHQYLARRWRGTYWTESLDDELAAGADQRGHRPAVLRLLGRGSPGRSSTGSSIPRKGRRATKFKHVIEPSVTMQYVSNTDGRVRPHRPAGVDRLRWWGGCSSPTA